MRTTFNLYGYVELIMVISTQPCLQHILCIGLEVLHLLTPLQMGFLCEFRLKSNVACDPKY